MALSTFRIKQALSATQVATRRRENFAAGELIMLVDGAESPTESRFIRLNGLRPSRSLECRYSIETEEFQEKTEKVAGSR